MFYIKFCVKCDWNLRGFLNIYIIFYNYVLNISNGKNAQQNYLSIELLLNLLAASFVEKTKILPFFFSNSEFGMRVYKGKIEARNEDISFTHFLGYLHEKLIFWKTLNWIQESSARSMICM